MTNVHLDELVLQTCASLMNIKSRIRLEPVSRLFAKVLRSANATCEISLTIRHDDILATEEESGRVKISITSGTKRAEWTTIAHSGKQPCYLPPSQPHNIHLNRKGRHNEPLNSLQQKLVLASNVSKKNERIASEEIFDSVLYQIFTRFKRFSCLNLCATALWVRYSIGVVLESVFLEGYEPVSFKQLVFKPGGYRDPLIRTLRFSECDCRLIKILAPALKKFMVLDGELPQEGSDLSKRFWTTLSTCSNLKKLYLCRLWKETKLFLNSDVRNCLQLLNISEFHSYEYNKTSSSDAEWIVESFKNNTKLRKLFLNPDPTDINEFLATPAVLAVVGRLRSVEIIKNTDDLGDVNSASCIRNIMLALPENGYANIEHVICAHLTPTAADEETRRTIVLNALAFWIGLSDEIGKPIRLYARICRGQRRISVETVDELKKQVKFTGIKIEHRIDRTNLQFNRARITLFYTLLSWKPYLPAEYAYKNGHI